MKLWLRLNLGREVKTSTPMLNFGTLVTLLNPWNILKQRISSIPLVECLASSPLTFLFNAVCCWLPLLYFSSFLSILTRRPSILSCGNGSTSPTTPSSTTATVTPPLNPTLPTVSRLTALLLSFPSLLPLLVTSWSKSVVVVVSSER